MGPISGWLTKVCQRDDFNIWTLRVREAFGNWKGQRDLRLYPPQASSEQQHPARTEVTSRQREARCSFADVVTPVEQTNHLAAGIASEGGDSDLDDQQQVVQRGPAGKGKHLSGCNVPRSTEIYVAFSLDTGSTGVQSAFGGGKVKTRSSLAKTKPKGN
uniref:Uncharacterized protein n=1 Tax=Sphaerodactylus townsendi TaxID=933632 RepID=A0ACB8EQZ0_9SAUR